MNTVEKREELLDIQMREFEKVNGVDKGSYAFVAGFYASMLKTLAADKIIDYTYVMEMLRRNSK